MLLGLRNTRLRRHRLIVKNASILRQLTDLIIMLSCLVILQIAAFMYFEGLNLADSSWLTLTTVTTVGYGDIAAKTIGGRVTTVILLYICGIAILAQAAAMYFEHRGERRGRMIRGDWSWHMDHHIVFLNCPDEVDEEYFFQAISGLRRSSATLANLPIIIISERFANGLSDRLRKLDVVHVSKPITNADTLNSASVMAAHTIVILSQDQLDPISDSINFDMVDRLRSMGVTSRIIVEAVKDENRKRLKKIGADNVLRPIRAYPEMLMRAIIAPGSEQVIETLFDSKGEECIKYNVIIDGKWLDIASKVISQDLGIPIAYEDTAGNIINNPSSQKQIHATALFVIVNKHATKSDKEIQLALN